MTLRSLKLKYFSYILTANSFNEIKFRCLTVLTIYWTISATLFILFSIFAFPMTILSIVGFIIFNFVVGYFLLFPNERI